MEMSYSKWATNQNVMPPTPAAKILRQVFALTKRGYFKWLAMSSPAYILMALAIFLLTKNAQLFKVNITNHSAVALHEEYYLLASLGVALVGVFWGQVFSTRSIAAEYFSYTPSDRAQLRAPFEKVAKAFLASVVIGIFFIIGYSILLVPGIIWYLINYLVVTGMALEDQPSFFDFFLRSRQLVKYNTLRIFGVQIVLLISQIAVNTVVAFLLSQTSLAAESIFMVLLLCSLLLFPVYSCAAFVFYADLRTQKEGISYEELSAYIGMSLTTIDKNSSFSGQFNSSDPASSNANFPFPYQSQYPANREETGMQAYPSPTPEDVSPNQSGFGNMPNPSDRVEFGSLKYVQDLSPADIEISEDQDKSGSVQDTESEDTSGSDSEQD